MTGYRSGLSPAERLALMQVAAVNALAITAESMSAPPRPLPFAMPAPLWVYAEQLRDEAIADACP